MVRLKNRYLLVDILYPEIEKTTTAQKVPNVVLFNQPTTDSLDPGSLARGIKAEVANLFGDYGSGAIADSISVKYLSRATSTFILRVNRTHYRMAWAALSFMDRIPTKNGKNCIFRVVRVSGTIRKCEQEAIRRAREMILKARREMGEQGDSTLDTLFGKESAQSMQDVLMVDGSDNEDDDENSEG